MDFVDLRSDTVTHPTPNMRQAIHSLPHHQDQKNYPQYQLESLAAEMFGKEAACLVPTGTFANQCALLTLTHPGETVLLADCSHMITYENGFLGRFARVVTRTLPSDQGLLDPQVVYKNISKQTRVLLMQFPTNLGRLYSLDNFVKICEASHKNGLKIHMDGARVFNGCYAKGISPKEIAKHIDSLMLCLSKGLCAPAGALILGTSKFIGECRKNRALLGGTMHDTSVMAAIGIVALRQMVTQTKTDNRIAQLFAKKISEKEWAEVIQPVEISMVFFKIVNTSFGLHMEGLNAFLQKHKILLWLPGTVNSVIRIVTHYYIREKEVEEVVARMDEYISRYVKKRA